MLEMDLALNILQKAGIIADRLKVEPLKEGQLNKIYKLAWDGGMAILWVDGKSDPGFERRSIQLQWVYSQLADLDLPIPQLLYPTELLPDKPAGYLLMTYLPGEPLEKALGRGDAKQQIALADAAGKALAHLHKTTAENIENIRQQAAKLGGQSRFGNPFEPPTGSDNWPERIEGQLENHLHTLEKITSTSLTERVASFMAERRALWSAPGHWGKVGLVHNDFTPNNILVQAGPNNGWVVSGIVDFEWSLIGPPEMDFAKLEAYGYPGLKTPRQTADYKEAFLSGYREIYPLGPNHTGLVAVYQLLFNLFWTNLEHSWGNPAGVENSVQQIEKILAQG